MEGPVEPVMLETEQTAVDFPYHGLDLHLLDQELLAHLPPMEEALLSVLLPSQQQEPPPCAEYLKAHPEVIKVKLERAAGANAGTATVDGISLIRTPAEGVKHRGKTPRPSCQWEGFAIIDCRAPRSSPAAAAETATDCPALTYQINPTKSVCWRQAGPEKAVPGVAGLTMWYFTPKGADEIYNKGHRMALYRLDGTQLYLVLVHDQLSNNSGRGQKRPRSAGAREE